MDARMPLLKFSLILGGVCVGVACGAYLLASKYLDDALHRWQ